MARKRSDELKRRIAQAYRNIDKAMEYLLEAKRTFEPVHPEYSQFIDVILQNTLVSQVGIQTLGKMAWGYFPKNTQSWIN